MDDKNLKKILHDAEIPVDANAKKRAVNVAVSEFQAHQKEKQKKSQGFPFLSRLMDKTTKHGRNDPMEKLSQKRLLQGSAVLMAGVALIALPIAFTQMQERSGTDSYSLIGAAPDIASTPGTEEAPQAYVDAIREVNEADVEAAYIEGGSSLPVPIEAPVGIISVPAEKAESGDKLQRWRRLQDERLQSELAQQPASKIQGNSAASNTPFGTMPRKTAESREALPPAGIMAEADMEISPMLMNLVPDDAVAPQYQDEGRDKFEDFKINPVKLVSEEPVSTFSTDVDTASYSFVRRQLNHGVLPQKDAVRVEELINYFDYNYPLPETREQPFKPTVTITDSPWAQGKKLMHVGIKGFDIQGETPRSNLVFLLDISGSMNAQDKLPLVKNALKMMLDNMNADDTISIVTYAGGTGVALEPTPASEKSKIINVLDNLRAGGGTAGAAGIDLAYQQAEQNFDEEAVNRVILATDGDFNVGITNHEELKDYVERKREKGIFLSVLGFGQGNYNDQMMQTLAQNGNGVAAYIDNLNEARKVLVEEASSTLFPIAKDVKIQVEFNPKTVAEYRLIGYETRSLNREDFNNDKVDAGDIGAGHTVTAIYEITPVGSEAVSIDPLRYGDAEVEKATADTDFGGEYAFLKMRYKLPNENTSKLITTPVSASDQVNLIGVECGPNESCPQGTSNDGRFSIAVSAFGQILKGGEYTGDYSYDDVIALANGAKGDDPFGYRAEFIQLVRLAKSLK